MWRQLRTTQLRELCVQLACVIETLGHHPPRREKNEDDDEADDDKKCDGAETEKSNKNKSDDATKSEKKYPTQVPCSPFSGAWSGFILEIPKEGQCDGAVGASMACLNAMAHHRVLRSVVTEHPEFHQIANAMTRAMASKCSCAWATFSTMFRLAGTGAFATKRLLTMPSAGSLLLALTNATRNRWPALRLHEMPAPTYLPRAPNGGEWQTPPPAPVSKSESASNTKRKKRRRERWREKSGKELHKEAKKTRKKEREKRELETGPKPETSADEKNKPKVGEPATNLDSPDSDSDSEDDDPLSASTNRLLLRTTAAATLASFAYTQRAWDEADVGSAVSRYDASGSLDAIDVFDDDVTDGAGGATEQQPGWRPPDYNQKLEFHGKPSVVHALDLWYSARGGDFGGVPTYKDLDQARRGVAKAYAVWMLDANRGTYFTLTVCSRHITKDV